MSEGAGDWFAFVAEIEPHVSPEWARNAREHGEQSWVRLISLVDVQNTLTSPQIVEKIASTMSDLAQRRPQEQAGWEAIHAKAYDRRRELLQRIDDLAPDLLSPELYQLFLRSATPVPEM